MFPDDIFSSGTFRGPWTTWARNGATDFWMPGFRPFRLSYHRKPDLYISGQARHGSIWEPLETAVILSLLPSGSVFYDLGAALGWYTIIAALKVGKAGRVVACEPESENYRLLRQNMKQNELTNVSAFKCAVSDRAGWGKLFRSTENLGDHRLNVKLDGRSSQWTRTTILLDLVANGCPAPDLIKIDTQGCEARILSCLPELCRLNPRLSLILEFWPIGLEECGSSYKDLLQALAAQDFDLFLLCELPRRFQSTTVSDLASMAEGELRSSPSAYVNVLALRRPAPDYLPAPDEYIEACLQLAASWTEGPTRAPPKRSRKSAVPN